jgi:membrane protease YdiL (CAAX protease family)
VGKISLFSGAALLLYVATHQVIPAYLVRTRVEPILLWFAVAGLGVFAPLVFLGLVMLWRETELNWTGAWRDRLRFHPMTVTDWGWCGAGLGGVILFSVGTLTVMRLLLGDVSLHPSFMTMEPLTSGRYWILFAWLPFWVLNILGEEFLWRGVILPRQTVAFGRWAWVANGSGWLFFHLAFGATVVLTLWPVTFILPYMVQKQRNSWVGVVIHAGLNGPGFVMVAFGLV